MFILAWAAAFAASILGGRPTRFGWGTSKYSNLQALPCLECMTDTDHELQEDREAEDLERRWRRGVAAMAIGSLVTLSLFWAGVYLLTQ